MTKFIAGGGVSHAGNFERERLGQAPIWKPLAVRHGRFHLNAQAGPCAPHFGAL
jgi:hypothetical protein